MRLYIDTASLESYSPHRAASSRRARQPLFPHREILSWGARGGGTVRAA